MAPAVDALSAGIGSLWGLMRDLTLPAPIHVRPVPEAGPKCACSRRAGRVCSRAGSPGPLGRAACALAAAPPPPPSY